MLNSNALRVIEGSVAELPLSLDLPSALPLDEWILIGRQLCQGQHAINWHIGDWWNGGVRYYGEAKAQAEAVRIFGLEYDRIRDCGYVAARFEVAERSADLTFDHHRRAAPLNHDERLHVLRKAEREGLSTRDVRRVVQELKAVNDPAPQQDEPAPVRASPQPPVPRNELTEAYGRFVEAMEALQTFRELTRREADYYAFTLDKLGEAHAERRPVPDDFKIVFVEQGRIACESWYRASRITVNRWLLQSGKQGLIEQRSQFVKHQRNMAHAPGPQPQATPPVDPYLPIARMAAEHLRISRYGGWRVSQVETGQGGWLVGTVHKSSEELIAMAERMQFDRQAAVTEARQEGY